LQAITGNRHVLGYVAVIDTERTVRSFGSVVFEPFFESHVLVLLERARPELVEVWDARSSQLLEDVHLLLIESFDHVPQRRRKPVAVHVERPFLILDKRRVHQYAGGVDNQVGVVQCHFEHVLAGRTLPQYRREALDKLLRAAGGVGGERVADVYRLDSHATRLLDSARVRQRLEFGE
jgi:hypothetical protein